MRRASPARLEKLFALIVTVGVPAGVMGAVACGGATQGTGSETDGGGASSSSGAGSSGSSSGTASSGSSSGVGGSSGSSSSSSSSGVGCGGCGCGPFDVTLDGGLPDGDPNDGGYLPYAECTGICGTNIGMCQVTELGPPTVVACQVLCLGRRPEGFRGDGACGRTTLSAHFASLAQLEAASVPAFRRMARELSRFGAPRRLVKAAERAAREEVRHARGATALAKRFGASGAAFEADVRGERSLEEFAIENAVEGCVRETYGALLATWQAREAKDPHVRAHMARIAKEETTHAALAWKADAWARAKLAKDARARVEAARDEATRALTAEVSRVNVDGELARVAGLPAPGRATVMAQRLADALA